MAPRGRPGRRRRGRVAPRRRSGLAKNGGAIVLETRATPGLGIAVNAKLDKATKDRVRAAFLSPNPRVVASTKVMGLDIGGAKAITSEDYKYVSTLGYFTPRSLPARHDGGGRPGRRDPQEGRHALRHAALRGIQPAPHPGRQAPALRREERQGGRLRRGQGHLRREEAPGDKNAPVVFACNGASAGRATRRASSPSRRGTSRSTGSAAASPSGASPGSHGFGAGQPGPEELALPPRGARCGRAWSTPGTSRTWRSTRWNPLGGVDLQREAQMKRARPRQGVHRRHVDCARARSPPRCRAGSPLAVQRHSPRRPPRTAHPRLAQSAQQPLALVGGEPRDVGAVGAGAPSRRGRG